MPAHLLFLTHEPPLPPASGARLRSLHLMEELVRHGHRVSLFALTPEDEVSPADRRQLAGLCQRVELWPAWPSRARRAARVAAASIQGRPFERRYFYSHRGVEAARQLIAELRPDAIVVGQLYMEPYLPPTADVPAILDSHNAEARRVATIARAGGARALLARRQLAPVSAFEAAVTARFERIWAVSEEERRYFESLAPGRVDVVPNGVEVTPSGPRRQPAAGEEILFLGRMDYGPNAEGARRLLEEVMPLVSHRGARVRIVGAGPPRVLRNAAERAAVAVEVTGFVPDVAPYLESARLLAVYLHAGGGTRLKILEALVRGLPVVSSSLGAEGLGLEHGREVLIGDDPATFARHIDALLDDDALCVRLAQRGRAAVQERFSWSVIGQGVALSVDRVLTRDRAASRGSGEAPPPPRPT